MAADPVKRLEGSVAGLEHEHRVIGRERAGRPAAAIHFYRFRLDGEVVELRHGAALPLNDGDEVVVACARRGREWRAYAFHNRTWGATLVEPPGPSAAMRAWLPLLPALPLAGIAAGAWPGWGAALAALAAGACGVLALRGLREYRRYRRAAEALAA